jgi:hypothetical protein
MSRSTGLTARRTGGRIISKDWSRLPVLRRPEPVRSSRRTSRRAPSGITCSQSASERSSVSHSAVGLAHAAALAWRWAVVVALTAAIVSRSTALWSRVVLTDVGTPAGTTASAPPREPPNPADGLPLVAGAVTPPGLIRAFPRAPASVPEDGAVDIHRRGARQMEWRASCHSPALCSSSRGLSLRSVM